MIYGIKMMCWYGLGMRQEWRLVNEYDMVSV